MYFTITTNKEVANQIEKQFDWQKRHGDKRSVELGTIRHEEKYSVIQITGVNGKKIEAEDIFWLGHYSANN